MLIKHWLALKIKWKTRLLSRPFLWGSQCNWRSVMPYSMCWSVRFFPDLFLDHERFLMKRYLDINRNRGSCRCQRNRWRRRLGNLVLQLTVTEQPFVFSTQTRPFRRSEYYLPGGFYVVASSLLKAMTHRLLQRQQVFQCPLLPSLLRWYIHPPAMVSCGYFVNHCCRDLTLRFSSAVVNSKTSKT